MFAPSFQWPSQPKPKWHRTRQLHGVTKSTCNARCVLDEAQARDEVPEGEQYCAMCAASDAREARRCGDDRTPNAETIAALQEADAGGGETFHGTAEEAFEKILAEDDNGTDGQGVRDTP